MLQVTHHVAGRSLAAYAPKAAAVVHVAGLTMPCRAQEGTPGPATPAFDANTELRIEAAVKERVGAELMEVMSKARQHGWQQVCYASSQRAVPNMRVIFKDLVDCVSFHTPRAAGSLAYRHCQGPQI